MIRHGFVSNSSSASFCIAKCYMSGDQIEKFEDIIRRSGLDWKTDDYVKVTWYTDETDEYFIGHYDDHGDEIREVIKLLGLKKYALVNE